MSESPLFVYAALKEALDARRIARKQGYLHKGDSGTILLTFCVLSPQLW